MILLPIKKGLFCSVPVEFVRDIATASVVLHVRRDKERALEICLDVLIWVDVCTGPLCNHHVASLLFFLFFILSGLDFFSGMLNINSVEDLLHRSKFINTSTEEARRTVVEG